MPVMAWNTILTTVSLGLGLFGITQAQTAGSTSTAFTDDKTGIQFQQTTKGDYTFGIALPAKSNGDLIGRISVKGTQGWAGVSLGGPMANSLMVIAWPHQKKIVSTLRHSQGYSIPNPTSNTTISLKTISAGTWVDGTTYTYTFLCKGCIQSDGSTFKADADLPTIGYAQAAVPVTAPADPFSAMAFHSSGYGLFEVNLAAARSEKFVTWAASAKDEPKANGPGAGGATPPAPDTSATTSGTTYDYIVIGSGPSGLITSQRLSETGKSVLLIERGGPSIASTGGKQYVPWNRTLTLYDVPALFLNMAIRTLGEGFCLDTAGLGGCILGGGGSMNGMAFIRPPSWDFDDKWPAGWKSKDMAPSAERLYARNPGTTLPSKDGKYYDNEVYTVMEEWLKTNGWNYADSIQSPNDKNRSYGHPAINVRAHYPVPYLPPLHSLSPSFSSCIAPY
jgi:cellobiose dehydrogenase (acceptor)